MLLCWLILLSFIAASSSQNAEYWSCRRSNQTPASFNNEQVLIVSLPRAGSSFVGALFRNDPNFVYLFEALRSYSESFRYDNCSSHLEPEHAKMTTETFGCNFNALKHSADAADSIKLRTHGYIYSWERIKEESSDVDICLNNTENVRKSVAVKEIEFWGPKLNWVYDNINPDLKVIWLVRDVRGWVSSWLENGTRAPFYNEWGHHKPKSVAFWDTYSNCGNSILHKFLDDQTLKRIEEVIKDLNAPPHLRMAAWWTINSAVTRHFAETFKGKIMLLRYEDISMDPIYVLQQIYQFLGRPGVHKNVLEWALRSTTQGSTKNRYGTNRDSKAMAEVWRTRLSDEQIKGIEEIAGNLFPFFEYQKA